MKSTVYLSSARAFLTQTAEEDAAIARKLVVKRRSDQHLMGNHAVYVADGEIIEQGIISFIFYFPFSFLFIKKKNFVFVASVPAIKT